jgi:hypothetical protein
MIDSEGYTIIETELGKNRDSGTWCWRARGIGLAEYCGEVWQNYSDADGWICGGPFSYRHEAERACKTFEHDYIREMHPDLEIKGAPDPRTLN